MRIPTLTGLLMLMASLSFAEEFRINGHVFTTADGLVVEQIAGQPLVDRPVSADFDERGRLYVTDSSGTNEPVEVQRKKRPHRIRRLEDVDGDGVFDKSTVYADQLMFPEGSMWFDGSLYVAAPPEIWKFTDTNDDGIADKREVWFDGKTLTHCANDLHGPYLGLDGWFYWCKGAYAEQSYERAGRSAFQTKAAHIFRRRPDGGPIEPVMTGGMANPVEVAFTPGGERIFTTTFMVNPDQGLRDGLIHAIYGGVYGKEQKALNGHPRTGDLMPVLEHLGAAAPCGLARLETNGLGKGFQNNLLATSFNKHNITRHVLTYRGAGLVSESSELIVSDNLDFHPTDVLEDADGSVIIVDTGGWFRLCCPTSQLEKADVLGGIYRLRRSGASAEGGAASVTDPRGIDILWQQLDAPKLAELLGDPRFAVRQRALQSIGKLGEEAVNALRHVLESSPDATHRRHAVWALTWIDGEDARAGVRFALADEDPMVRQAALHSISVRKDKLAAIQLRDLIRHGPAFNRRAAAEALGRVGSSKDIPALLTEVPLAIQRFKGSTDAAVEVDRSLEHSLMYAAMELGDIEQLRSLVDNTDPRIRRAALIVLDQVEGGSHLQPGDILPLLASENSVLNDAGWWLAYQHVGWGDAVARAFHVELTNPPEAPAKLARLGERLRHFSGSPLVQLEIARTLEDKHTPEPLRLTLLGSVAASGQKPVPAAWAAPLLAQLDSTRPFATQDVIRATLAALNQLSAGKLNSDAVARILTVAAENSNPEIRLRALNLLPANQRRLDPALLDFVCTQIAIEADVTNRSLAVDLLKSSPLDREQLKYVAGHLPRTGAMELQPLMALFAKSKDPQVGSALVDGLLKAPAATALFPDRLKELLANFGGPVVDSAAPLLQRIDNENRNKLARVEKILDLLPTADVRRGLQVFQGAKASCIACHRRGYLGGAIGPDLNRIGAIRSERDLLESILFPSLTFVRSYEPVSIATDDGEVFSGLLQDETETTVTLQLDAKKTIQILKSSIERRKMGDVSIMPAGLEKQLSPQDMADLVKYLKEG